ncbi:MAG TPA: YbgF trimerization domain-containing protein, partial [Ramlibacter sp.]|nr:YbgF trimerization domain-containing protein [Ramlibacter sp.]
MKRSALAALAAASLFTAGAHAALFEDDEARRAILELRQRVEQQRVAGAEELRRASEENATLRRSLLELQNQIEQLRAELARMRGQDEQIARDLADVQKRQRDMAQGVEERLRRFEPVQVTVDGREFSADPAEQRDF